MGVVGPNGCGKTTLARLIAGKLEPTSGAVMIDGGTHGADYHDSNDHPKAVWYIGSDPEMQFITATAFDEVAIALQVQGVAADEIMVSCEEALRAVGLQEVKDVHPFFLSTGEQFRLLLAVALAQKPSYLLLDEVTSMMDGHTRYAILRLLDEQRQRSGMAIALFTHRMEDLLGASSIAVMHDGEIPFVGTVADVFVSVQNHPLWHVEVPLAYRFGRALPPIWQSRLAEVLVT